ncbi:unnamed protein product, partial [Notodromas monacha]
MSVFGERVMVNAPVTAACFLTQDLVAVGQGNILEIYEVPGGKQVYQAEVLRRGTDIKGLKFVDHDAKWRLLAFGDRFLVIVSLKTESFSSNRRIEVKKPNENLTCEDWLISVDILSNGSEEELILLTAHNRVQIFVDHHRKALDCCCTDQSLVVCGRVLREANDDLIVITGTMFSEVLIWSCCGNEDKESVILHRLKGHQGIVFHVQIDPTRKYLLSTSDDRSVRIWTRVEGDSWSSAKFQCSPALYGHGARVWAADFLGGMLVASAGEDSQVCVWNWNTNSLHHRLSAHGGASLRCLAVSRECRAMFTPASEAAGIVFHVQIDPTRKYLLSTSDDRSVRIWTRVEGDSWSSAKFQCSPALYGHGARVWAADFLGGMLVASAGEDSQVCVWNWNTNSLHHRLSAHGGASLRCLAVSRDSDAFVTGGSDGACKYFPNPRPAVRTRFKPGPAIRSVHSVDNIGSHLFVTCVSGLLQLVSCLDNNNGQVKWESDESALLNSYACSDVAINCETEGGGFRVVCAGLGPVLLFLKFRETDYCCWTCDDRKEVDVGEFCRSKICFVKWLGEDVLVSDAEGQTVLVGTEISLLKRNGPAKSTWATAAAVSTNLTQILLGYRDGAIQLFHRHKIGDEWNAVGTEKRNIFGKHGASTLVFDERRGVFWGAGRKGVIFAWKADSTGLHLLEKSSSKHEWIGSITVFHHELRIVTFHSRYCVIHDEQGEEIWRVDCGGGHRSWAISSDNSKFFFVKEGILYMEQKSQGCVATNVLK